MPQPLGARAWQAYLTELAQLMGKEDERHGGIAHALTERGPDPTVTFRPACHQQHRSAGYGGRLQRRSELA